MTTSDYQLLPVIYLLQSKRHNNKNDVFNAFLKLNWIHSRIPANDFWNIHKTLLKTILDIMRGTIVPQAIKKHRHPRRLAGLTVLKLYDKITKFINKHTKSCNKKDHSQCNFQIPIEDISKMQRGDFINSYKDIEHIAKSTGTSEIMSKFYNFGYKCLDSNVKFKNQLCFVKDINNQIWLNWNIPMVNPLDIMSKLTNDMRISRLDDRENMENDLALKKFTCNDGTIKPGDQEQPYQYQSFNEMECLYKFNNIKDNTNINNNINNIKDNTNINNNKNNANNIIESQKVIYMYTYIYLYANNIIESHKVIYMYTYIYLYANNIIDRRYNQ